MKTIFKDFSLFLACIGAVSLLLSVIDKPKENAQLPIDRYHITASSSWFIMYNTETGEYKLLDLRKDKSCDDCNFIIIIMINNSIYLNWCFLL